MKTKQETVDRILNRFHLCGDHIETILQEELPDFNPYRIDEERFKAIYNNSNNEYDESYCHYTIEEYNSTLPPALQSLPKEMPEGFMSIANQWNDLKTDTCLFEVWDWVQSNYGTPQKQELPSVEELESEISRLRAIDLYTSKQIAQHILNKYALHSQEKEWWMKLKKGDKFRYYGKLMEYSGEYVSYLIDKNNNCHLISDCTPYTESELEKGLKTADENTKNLIKLACEEAIKTGKIPTI